MKKFEECSDEELIDAYRHGDFSAVETLCDRYHDLVKRIGARYFIKGGEKEDVIQEGMLGLFKAIQSFDETKGVPFLEFARLCITRQIQKAMESADTLKNQPLNSYVSFNGDEKSPDEMEIFQKLIGLGPEAILLDSEMTQETYDRIVASLSKMELQVFSYMMQGYDYKTIAYHMKKPEKSIDNAIQRIRGKVRKLT